jgi:hypothetical protein
MYQIAIVSAATCLLLSVVALLFARHLPRTRWLWLAVSGAAWATSVGCRATYIFAGFIYIFIAFYWWLPRLPREGARPILREEAAWAVPAMVVLLAVGWYNWARFDSPFEFGMRYCVAGMDYRRLPTFGMRYFADRLWEWTLMPFQFVNHFPYVDPSVREQDFFYRDRVFFEHFTGLVPSFPLLVVGLLWFRNVRRLEDAGQRRRLLSYGLWVSVALVGTCSSFLVYCAVTFRYLMDLTTPLYLLTALSLMARFQRGPLRCWEWLALGAISLLTLYTGFAYSLIGDPCWIWHRDIDVLHLTVRNF